MDYEKAYKAVLETATQWIKDGCTDKEKICLESVFPELRESKDERIRKEIIAILKKSYNVGGFTLNNKKDLDSYLAYLEKQKPENVSATTMIPSCWEAEQKEQKPTIAGNDFGWIDELKHDLEHPKGLYHTCFVDGYKEGYEQAEKDIKDDLLEWAKGFTDTKIFVSTVIEKINSL